MLGGGGTYDAVIWKTLVWPQTGEQRPRTILIDTSATIEDRLAHEKAAYAAKHISRAGGVALCVPRPLPCADSVAKMIRRCDGVWFTGGKIGAIAHRYRGTSVPTQLRQLLMQNGLVGGTSAGAVALCQRTWNQKSNAHLGWGLDIIPNVLLSVHAGPSRRAMLSRVAVDLGTHKLALEDGEYVVVSLGNAKPRPREALRSVTEALREGVRAQLRKKPRPTEMHATTCG